MCLDDDDFERYTNLEEDKYLFEGITFESDIEILEILLERKEKYKEWLCDSRLDNDSKKVAYVDTCKVFHKANKYYQPGERVNKFLSDLVTEYAQYL